MSKRTRHREPAPASTDRAGPEAQQSRDAICAAVFASVAERLERQRAAILTQDSAAIARSFDALVPLLGDLSAVIGSVDASADLEGNSRARIADLARQARQQIWLNQTLVANGTAIADHFVLCVAEASPTISPALFSEVA
jgi:hypothetical protein